MDAPRPVFSIVFVIDSATGGPAARRVAQSATNASSSSAGTTRLTMPKRSASAASTTSAKNASSLALCRPMSRGNSHEPPQSSDSPRWAKISEKRAASDATIRSHPSARLAPIPAATPGTFAIVGVGAEVTTGAGQHEHAVVGLGPQRAKCVGELVRHGPVHRVLLLRSVHRDGDDAGVARDDDRFELAHGGGRY